MTAHPLTETSPRNVHAPRDQQGCRQAAGCISWVRGAMVLRRAIRRTTADKLLLHHSFLKGRQTDSKEIGSTGKCDCMPGFLYISLQEACVFKDTYPWESMDVHIHVWVWVHYITTHLYKLHTCICLHNCSSYTPENPLLSFPSRRGEKPWRTNGVVAQQEHSFISSSNHGLPESQMQGPLKLIKGFGQGSFKVSFCKHLSKQIWYWQMGCNGRNRLPSAQKPAWFHMRGTAGTAPTRFTG